MMNVNELPHYSTSFFHILPLTQKKRKKRPHRTIKPRRIPCCNHLLPAPQCCTTMTINTSQLMRWYYTIYRYHNKRTCNNNINAGQANKDTIVVVTGSSNVFCGISVSGDDDILVPSAMVVELCQ